MEQITKDKAEKIADNARTSISSFCSSECNAYCCRKGSIKFTALESKVILKDGTSNSVAILPDGTSQMLFAGHGCPQLSDDCLCKVHKDNDRPMICKEFPILVRGTSVLICKDCPAVMANKFYGYEAQFMDLGFNCVRF